MGLDKIYTICQILKINYFEGMLMTLINVGIIGSCVSRDNF